MKIQIIKTKVKLVWAKFNDEKRSFKHESAVEDDFDEDVSSILYAEKTF